MWESLIARLRKSERVEREIERVSDERVVVGMWVSWVSVCIERGSFVFVIKLRVRGTRVRQARVPFCTGRPFFRS